MAKEVITYDNGVSAAILVSRTIKLPICYVTGYVFSTGKAVIQFDFADGTVDENGKAKPYSTLLTKHLQYLHDC